MAARRTPGGGDGETGAETIDPRGLKRATGAGEPVVLLDVHVEAEFVPFVHADMPPTR